MPKLDVTKKPVKKVASAVCAAPWAIEESVLNAMCELLELRADGREFTSDEVRLRIGAARGDETDEEDPRGPYTADGVAVLPLTGVLAPRMNFFMDISGGTSTQEFANWFQAALDDPKVKAILLAVDSPGGDARGNEELAQQIRAARGQKPIVAAVSGMAASAAYYVASAADEMIVSPSAEVGSIGTYMIHSEASQRNATQGVKYTVVKAGANKAAGNSVEPLTEKSKAVLQERIDDYNALFENAVAKNRGVSRETVQQNFGQGKSMIASKAVAAGLADRVGTFAQAFEFLKQKIAATAGNAPGPVGGNRSPLSTLETVMSDTAAPAAAPAPAPAPVATPAAAATAINPPPAGPTAEQAREIANRERARIQDLTARASLLGIDQAQLQEAIDQATPVSDALVKWTAAKAAVEKPVSGGAGARVTEAGADKLFQGSLEALSRRSMLRESEELRGKKLGANARDLQYCTLFQIAEKFVAFSGHAASRVMGIPEDVAAAALRGLDQTITIPRGEAGLDILAGDQGYQRPADFPNLLSALMGKMMDLQLTYSPATYQGWAYQIPAVPDFKPKTIIALGEYAELPRVADGADFTESSVSEEASWIQADAYGDEWTLTPKMVVDDDLGQLEEVVRDKVIAHEMTLNRLCVNLITGNASAGDGNNVFDSSNHGNDRTSGGAPSTTELSAMRLLFRKMKGVSARRKLNLTLRTLLIPEDLETTTQQLLATLTLGGQPSLPIPVTSATTEVFRGNVNYFVDPMLADNSTSIYYGFAERNTARAIIYAFQRGFEGLRTRNYFWPKNNARVFQFEGRFAAAIRNWRGVVRNNGS